MGREDATLAFSLLGNETRLRIVLELGEASSPGEYATLTFSELQSRVGERDNGTFNYHLGQLTEEFVERTDEGYRLALPGIYVYRALKTGPLAETPDRGRLETDTPCPACAASQTVWIEDGRGHLGCPDCETVNYRYPLPAGGQDRRDGPELVRALRQRAIHDANAMLRGFCPYCSGPVVRRVRTDADVLPDGAQGADETTMSLACEHCRWFLHMNPAGLLESHPRVHAFLLERGLDSYERDPWREAAFAVDVRSEVPWRANVFVTYGGETLALTLDDDLVVCEVEREQAPAIARGESSGDGETNRPEEDDGDDGDGDPGVTGRGSGV